MEESLEVEAPGEPEHDAVSYGGVVEESVGVVPLGGEADVAPELLVGVAG